MKLLAFFLVLFQRSTKAFTSFLTAQNYNAEYGHRQSEYLNTWNDQTIEYNLRSLNKEKHIFH